MAMPNVKSQTEAAINVGYSPKSAAESASENLRNSKISKAIEERQQRALLHSRIMPEEVLGATVFKMRSSIGDLLDESGSFGIEKARKMARLF